MKLKYVHIRNFRSIQDIKITFEQRCRVLVGINESGKSNILHALAQLDPEQKATSDDLRELGRDESPDQAASIWFVFSLDPGDRLAIYQALLEKVYGDPTRVLSKKGGRGLTLKQLCEGRTEGLYCVDLVQKAKTGSYWSFLTEIAVSENWKKPVKASQVRVTNAAGTAQLITKYSLLDADAAKDVSDDQLLPVTNDDVHSFIGRGVIEFVVDNLPPVVFWEYSENNLLPASINTGEFTADPDTCLPLKHMFELAGYTDVTKAIEDAGRRANGLRNLLDRVADLTTRHMRSVWKDLKNVKVQLTQQGNTIEAVVRDAVNAFNFQRRSDGFKRFFTFLLLVSVKAKTKKLRDTLYLHDEPEISLHPSGAQFLRDELISISANNDVVYSTHSIFMIDRKNVGRHLIVKRTNEITTLDPVDQSNLMEEEVLYNALNWSVFESLRQTNIIFEGWRDQHLFAVAISRIPSDYKDISKAVQGWGSCYAKGVSDVRRVAAMLQLANRTCFIVSDADKVARDHQAAYDGYGQWERYDQLGAQKVVTAEDFILFDHFETVAKKFLLVENSALPTFENVVPVSGGGRLDALRNWLVRNNAADPKSTMERFKTVLFDGLKSSHIEHSYFEMLRSLAKRLSAPSSDQTATSVS